MDQSIIALIILVITLVLYVTEVISLTMTSLISMLAMLFSGILTPTQAFSGFSNTSMLLLACILIIGDVFTQTGLSLKIAKVVERFSNKGEKTFMIVLFLLNAVLSVFMNSAVLIAIFMPIIDAVAKNSNGKITRKGCYLPAAIGGVLGGCCSIIGSTSVLTGDNIDQMNKLPVGHSPYAYDVFGNMMAHTLLNRKQFDRLYAKPYKRLFEACEKYKKTFISYSEGCFERFGDFFNQYRKGTVALMVEQDDIFDFRKKYPHIALWGGIMVDTLGHGTVEENIDMTKKVIDEVGCDSGLVLQPNKMLTFEYDCIPENLIAISNFIMTYKV